MNTSRRSVAELKSDANRKLPNPKEQEWFDAEIEEVTETKSKNENDMFKCLIGFVDTQGHKWTLTEYLTDTGKGGLKFYAACVARGVGEKYEAGAVDQSDLPGPCRIKIEIEKKRGWPDKLRVADFAPVAASSVVNLRSAG